MAGAVPVAPAGAIADIVDRRRLLIVSQLAMAISVGALAILTLADVVTPWMLLVLALVLGISSAFNDPAWQAVIPELLPKEELSAGITLSGIGEQSIIITTHGRASVGPGERLFLAPNAIHAHLFDAATGVRL